MALTQSEKSDLAAKFGVHESDTGSPEVQIAIFSKRIDQLQSHLKDHKHDQSSRRGLLRLVGKRRRLLAYMRNNYPDRYQVVLKELGLRR